MNATIYTYTGTGNSLWAARTLAELLPGSLVRPMTRLGFPAPATETVGLVFPVYMWGLPAAVRDFVDRLDLQPGAYLFAVAVNAGQVAGTLLQLQKRCARRGLRLASGLSLVLPSNYIPWGGPGSEAAQQKRIQEARSRLDAFAPNVQERRVAKVDRGPLWQRLLFTPIYRQVFPRIPGMDRAFTVDERCTSCGICARVCPAGNINLDGGRPTWRHQCEQCLACLQWCPVQAIQFGPKTEGLPRYHHPEIDLATLLDFKEEGQR